MDREATFRLVAELVSRPAPSGVEHALDAYLEERLGARGLRADGAGNRLLRIAGRERRRRRRWPPTRTRSARS